MTVEEGTRDQQRRIALREDRHLTERLRDAVPQLHPRTLLAGESVEFWVHAQIPWNDSRIDLVAGGRYDFAVLGSQNWNDSSIVSSADGYRSRPRQQIWERLRRIPNAKWMELIGTIGKSMDYQFVIGNKLLQFSPSVSGRLYYFANDLRVMYWNNSGSIKVILTRSN